MKQQRPADDPQFLEWPPTSPEDIVIWDLADERDLTTHASPYTDVVADAAAGRHSASITSRRTAAMQRRWEWRAIPMLVATCSVIAIVVVVADRWRPMTGPTTAPSNASVDAGIPGGTTGAPAIPPAGRIIVQKPVGARIFIDGARQGTAPLTVAPVRVGDHEIMIETTFGTLRERVAVEAGSAVAIVVPNGTDGSDSGVASSSPRVTAPGWIDLLLPFQVQVFENGRFVATNDSERILMPAGLHTIDVVNEALNFRASTTVDVSAGEASRADVTVPTGTLSVNAVPWSEVFVDGRSVGETPLAGISVLVGAHEIVFRHPDLGERRRTVVVPAGAPAIRVSVDFAQ